jgi:hypothetical protein
MANPPSVDPNGPSPALATLLRVELWITGDGPANAHRVCIWHNSFARAVDLKAKLLAVLDQAEGYRVLAIRSRDRGERESYERIVELYVSIGEELEAMIDS